MSRKRSSTRDLKYLGTNQIWRCNGCFAFIGRDSQVDHVIPLSRGGSDDWCNKQILCAGCHSDKTAGEVFKTPRLLKGETVVVHGKNGKRYVESKELRVFETKNTLEVESTYYRRLTLPKDEARNVLKELGRNYRLTK